MLKTTASKIYQVLPQIKCFDFCFELLVVKIYFDKIWRCLLSMRNINSVNIECLVLYLWKFFFQQILLYRFSYIPSQHCATTEVHSRAIWCVL